MCSYIVKAGGCGVGSISSLFLSYTMTGLYKACIHGKSRQDYGRHLHVVIFIYTDRVCENRIENHKNECSDEH